MSVRQPTLRKGHGLPLAGGPAHLEHAREPTEMLLACHERIRFFTAMALELAGAAAAPPDRIADAGARLRRYFGLALPLHERDEEDSVAPRLLDSTARTETEDALASMAREHRAADALLGVLDPVWARVTASPSELASVADELRERSEALSALMAEHLRAEEAIILPAVARTLSGAARAEVLREIRERRTPEVRRTMAALTGGPEGARGG